MQSDNKTTTLLLLVTNACVRKIYHESTSDFEYHCTPHLGTGDNKLQLKQCKLNIIEDRAASKQRAPATLPHTIKMRLQFAPTAA
jgi:hypothetical protein